MFSNSYLPAQAPPALGVVEAVNPKAAEALRALQARERAPEWRVTDPTESTLDELRATAFDELGDENFFGPLAEEKVRLLAELAKDTERLETNWRRLEDIAGLQHWRDHGQIKFSPRVITAMKVVMGNGYDKTVTGRQLIQSLAESIKTAGH